MAVAPQQEINLRSGAKLKPQEELNGKITSSRICFGVFEVNLRDRELRKFGLRVRLQQKPFQILERLLQTPGEFVSRDELAKVLWPNLHVLFDRSLNTAVNAVRRALGDPGRNPQFIETRNGLGYRFIAQVEQVDSAPVAKAVRRGSTEAYRDYLKGRYFSNRLTEEDLHKSIAYFESSLAHDPDYAPAYAGLADTHTLFAFLAILPACESFARARKFAEKALRLDGELAEAHTSIAQLKRACNWDWTGAEAAYRRALELNGDDARLHCHYAAHLSTIGSHQEALKEIAAALELDPLSLVINTEAAWMFYVARDFQAAVEQSWKTLAMESRFAPAQNTLGLAYLELGMIEEAIVELDNACVCSGEQPSAVAALVHALAIAGKRREAEEALEKLKRVSKSRHVSPYWFALAYTGLGACDAAFERLNQACLEHDAWMVWLKVEPRFDPLRADGRFSGLLSEMGL